MCGPGSNIREGGCLTFALLTTQYQSAPRPFKEIFCLRFDTIYISISDNFETLANVPAFVSCVAVKTAFIAV